MVFFIILLKALKIYIIALNNEFYQLKQRKGFDLV